MSAIRYSYPIRPVPTYVLRAAKRRTCTKFHQDSSKTERLVCIETDRQTDGQTDGYGYIDSARRPDQEYIYFMGSDTPPSRRYKLRDKIIIPSARV